MVLQSRPIDCNWTLSAIEPPPHVADRLAKTIPAKVPGNVHLDLLACRLIADPYLDTNELTTDWVGATTWQYETVFEWSSDGSERAELVFEVLDTVARVALNGAVLGSTFNMHRTFRFDVTDLLL